MHSKIYSGNIEEFEAIIKTFRKQLYFTAYSCLHNQTDAEEIVQETFIDAYFNFGKLKNREALPSWLCSIARNKAKSLYTKKIRLYPVDDVNISDKEYNPYDITARHEQNDIVMGAIMQLSDTLRETILLHYYGGQKISEISGILSVSEGTIKSRLHAARNKLRKELSSVMDIKKLDFRKLEWVPEGKPAWHKGWFIGYARGIELILKYLKHDTDYDTVMGDLGQPFIIQGQENSSNIIDGAVDTGWWPLEPISIVRLDFLERTVGRKIHYIKPNWDDIKSTPEASYKEYYEKMVIDAIKLNRPCLLQLSADWVIITGYNSMDSSLIGMCLNEEQGKEKISQITGMMPPYAGIYIGERTPSISRSRADIEALKYAVSLHRDEVLNDNIKGHGSSDNTLIGNYSKHWRTGIMSYRAWIMCIENPQNPGQPYWQNNVRVHLLSNRLTAIRFLSKMKTRHSTEFNNFLDIAISYYKKLINKMESCEINRKTYSTKDGRAKLVNVIKEVMEFETFAIDAITKAIQCE